MNRGRSLNFHLFLIALSYWTIYVQLTYRIPGGYALALLPLVNVAATCLTLVIMILRFMGSVPIEKPLGTLFRYTQNSCSALIVAFGLYNGLVYINARWDNSTLQTIPSEIVEVGGREIELVYPIRYFWTDLRSWRSLRNTERMLLKLSERENLWVGRAVLLRIHRGYFNVPWISAVNPNQEKEWIEIISKIPTASAPRRDLTYLYLEQHRWADVERLAAEQMRFYPSDLVFIRYVSGVLLNAARFSEIVTVLEPVAKQRADYQIWSKLGFALAMTGRKPEGLKYLEAAIEKDPRNYWGYAALGYAHFYTGTPQKAVPYFEKVLQLRPNYPEIHDVLSRIRMETSNTSTR